jgi:glycosyltransferase involved in cell wall biosynthesis
VQATVVIPTFNRSARLAELLHCLSMQPRDVLARIVVCDDGSTDDTSEVARGFATRLPVEYCWQENRGFRAGQARNLGIARARGDIVIFVDDDVLVAPDFVAAHLDSHRNEREPLVAIGYRHRSFDGHHGVPDFDAIVRSEPDDRVEVLGADGVGVTEHATPWFFVYSCNFSVARRDGLARFDDHFHGWGMEDIEYGYRLVHTGYRVVSAPRARVLHVEDPAPRDPFRCEVRNLEPTYDSYVHNSIYFMDKYPDDAVLAELIRTDMRWYVRDEDRGCWVKNGHANDVDAVVSFCRRARQVRSEPPHSAHRSMDHAPPGASLGD